MVIDESHGLRDGAMSGLLGDQAVHLLADPSIGRVPLRSRAQLEQVHRLTRVHLHREADAVGHRERVRRLLWELRRQRPIELGGPLHRGIELLRASGGVDRVGPVESVTRRQRLPLDGEHAVTLEVSERAVVSENVEPVVDPLERATGLVPAVAPVADIRAHNVMRSSVVSRRTRASS